MASYYDEHNCPELTEGETPGPLILARMLHDLGLTDNPDSVTPAEFNLDNEFRRLFGDDTRPPPASKEFIANLPDCELMLKPDAKCAICIGDMVLGSTNTLEVDTDKNGPGMDTDKNGSEVDTDKNGRSERGQSESKSRVDGKRSVSEEKSEDRKRSMNPERIVSLPCKHSFHCPCIVMWISKVSTCPLCKENLPTDDVLWEEYIKQVKLEQKQKRNFKNVQYSMYA